MPAGYHDGMISRHVFLIPVIGLLAACSSLPPAQNTLLDGRWQIQRGQWQVDEHGQLLASCAPASNDARACAGGLPASLQSRKPLPERYQLNVAITPERGYAASVMLASQGNRYFGLTLHAANQRLILIRHLPMFGLKPGSVPLALPYGQTRQLALTVCGPFIYVNLDGQPQFSGRADDLPRREKLTLSVTGAARFDEPRLRHLSASDCAPLSEAQNLPRETLTADFSL